MKKSSNIRNIQAFRIVDTKGGVSKTIALIFGEDTAKDFVKNAAATRFFRHKLRDGGNQPLEEFRSQFQIEKPMTVRDSFFPIQMEAEKADRGARQVPKTFGRRVAKTFRTIGYRAFG